MIPCAIAGYSSDLDTDSGPLLQYLEPLFVNYSVDVVFAGHMHSVEVRFPAYNLLPCVFQCDQHEILIVVMSQQFFLL